MKSWVWDGITHVAVQAAGEHMSRKQLSRKGRVGPSKPLKVEHEMLKQ